MKILRGKGFKTFAVVLSFTLIAAAGYFFFAPVGDLSAQDAKPLYKGTVYSATRGGHMVFTTITIDPNRDMISGTVAGRLPLPNNTGADAIEMAPNQKTIYYPTWDSTLYTIDISGKEPKIIAEKKFFDKETKMCGSHIGPDGKLYLSSMSLGDIHKLDVSDPKDPKLMDRLYKTTYLCGVQVVDDGKYIFTTDMKDHKIYIYDAKTHEKIKEITPGGKEFLHRARLSHDGKLLYQASTGSTTADANGRVYIVDTKKMKVKDTIVFGVNYDAHDVATTPDGKYAIVAVRRVPAKEYKDSEYIVVNLQTKKTIGSISMCKSCHNAMGVDPEVKSGREVFICGIQIAWEK
jgi:WD40 repeat protein